MRRFLALAALCAPLTLSAPAQAMDSVILDTITGWLGASHADGDLADLRERAEEGDAKANYEVFVAYRTVPREGAGPRVAGDTLVSRAEAEAGLHNAAAAGLPDAVFALGRLLFEGGMVKQDEQAAKPLLERAHQGGAASDRAIAGSLLGEILLFSDTSSAADKARGFALVDEALRHGLAQAIRAKSRALREGIGTKADPEAARTLLADAVAAGNGFAYAPLGDMMLTGEGGPKDVEEGLALLGNGAQSADGLGRAMLADRHLDGTIAPRLPRRAIALLADHAVVDVATRQKLGALLLDYGRSVPRAEAIAFALAEDEDAGETDAAWLLLRLARDGSAPFRNDAVFYDVMERRAHTDPRIGLVNAEQLAIFSTRGSDSAGSLAEAARLAVDSFIARNMPAAHRLKGNLLRKGWAYEQDDVAATAAFKTAAELGDAGGMLALAEAYDDGLGIEEDASQSLTWLRKAAGLGSIEARRKIVHRFPFDVFDRQMTLREGITDSVALYGDQLGSIDAIHFLGLFSNSRLDDFGPGEPVLAFMDGFRAAPAGLDDALLVPLARQLPKEVLAAVEAVLTEQGFYQGEAEGYFRPDARKALSAWVTAKGPLPPADLAETAATTAGPALPDVPAAVLERANAMAIEAIRSGRSDEEKAAALGMVADLARFGDPQSRWALLRNYHAPEAEMLRAIVSPAEITRFGIDLLLTADSSMEKLDGEFTFAMSQIYVDGHTAEFAESFVAMLREDARLRNRPVLGDVLMALVFIPGACDAAIDRAIAEGATSLTPGGYCGDLPVRDGFLAFADNAPPSDVEAAARRAAAAKIKALADLAAAQ